MKTLLSTLFLMLMVQLSYGQVAKHALGLRLDGDDGLGPEISYQMGLDEISRIEFDLGIRNTPNTDAFKLTVLYQKVHAIKALPAGFDWYYGLGAGAGIVDYSDDFPFNDPNNNYETLILTIDGMLGAQYRIPSTEFPLLISLDLNPELNVFNDYYDPFDLDFALGLRWQF